MYTIKLTLNTMDTEGYEPMAVDDPRQVREILGLKPREKVHGYAFTSEVNEGRGYAITNTGRCIPVPDYFFVSMEEIAYCDE